MSTVQTSEWDKSRTVVIIIKIWGKKKCSMNSEQWFIPSITLMSCFFLATKKMDFIKITYTDRENQNRPF